MTEIPPPLSPKEYLKARRPERFSDSVVEARHALNRTLLEHHLDTLTQRNQEADFERFAYELAKLEICPNLLPNTGPMGGGDSKVDTETYPVAENLSLSWYVGDPKAGSERWAFAFSCTAKAKVTPKISSDVAKIARTKRGYTRAFFISSQYIKASKRAELEDKLSKTHSLSVVILDRGWILDRVFSSGREQLAVDQLRIQISPSTNIILGPNDTERKKMLADAEGRLSASLAQVHPPLSAVDDALKAAILSSELELPRIEQEGRFTRAVRIADEYGTEHKRLLARYHYAWTSYFWLEDIDLFQKLYGEVEALAKGTDNIHELELLNSLWQLLRNAVDSLGLDGAACLFAERTRLLRDEFERHAKIGSRPSAALQARTWLLNMRFDRSNPDEAADFFRGLKGIVEDAEHLIGYPILTLFGLIEQFGELYAAEPAYEELIDTVTKATEARSGDIAAARVLLRQAARQAQIKSGQALRTAGKALVKLHKNETRSELGVALCVCAYAYEKAGLLWAARGALLTAAHFATEGFWKHEKVTLQQVECYSEIKWLELRLGRIPHALEWHQADRAIRAVFVSAGGDRSRLPDDEAEFDGCVADLFLQLELPVLREFECLPDALDELGLSRSRSTLAFALGDEEAMKKGLEPEDAAVLTPEFFRSLQAPRANDDRPTAPASMDSPTVELRSRILGCELILIAENASPCVEVGESFLAALEALLATGFSHRILAHAPQLAVTVVRDEGQVEMLRHAIDSSDGEPTAKLTCAAFNPHRMSLEVQAELKLMVSTAVAHVLAHAFFVDGIDATMHKLVAEEQALERSLSFSSSFVVIGSVLSDAPRFTAAAWSIGRKRYGLQRAERWDDGMPTVVGPEKEVGRDQDSLSEHSDDAIPHDKVRLVTSVRHSLWEKAGQIDIGFSVTDSDERPIMALIFSNGNAAKRIFARWRAELGETDPADRLRLVIVRGINAKEPQWYRLVISANPDPAEKAARLHTYRIVTAQPAQDTNLRSFLERYLRLGEFLFLPGQRQETTGPPLVFQEHALKLKPLHIRDAYEIGPDDQDIIGLAPDDQPVIPLGMEDAPVEKALRQLKAISLRKLP